MYVECLSHMKVNGQEANFPTYATKWLEEQNRGALFEVSDSTFALFSMLEVLIRKSVPLLSKEKMHEIVGSSETIQCQWNLTLTMMNMLMSYFRRYATFGFQ